MSEDKEKNNNVMQINPGETTLSVCIDKITELIRAVRDAGQDYYNTNPVISLFDEVNDGDNIEMQFNIPIDLKVLGVIAAITQASLSLRGSTDLGKTALAERILTGLFGPHGDHWWRMEINRGITIDDLIDVDVNKLSTSKLSESVEAAKWLSKPARLLDEINRVHPKLLNLVLHLIDGSGFNARGDLSIPVGQPYQLDGQIKRFSFSITTANQLNDDYAGVFEEDMALTRRIVLSADLDELPPRPKDVSQMLANRRAKSFLQKATSHTKQVIEIYEALPRVISFSATAHLFLHYLAGLNTCIRTRCGRIQPQLKPRICEKCHLAKSNRFCGRVGGLSEGLLLWTKELSTAIAAMRASLVLNQVQNQNTASGPIVEAAKKLQNRLGISVIKDKFYEKFRKFYLEQLCVTGEDVKAAFVLIAPNHVWIDHEWFKNQDDFEGKPLYLFQEVAREGWTSMLRFLKDHQNILKNLSSNIDLSSTEQTQIEAFITTKDPAVLAVISGLRDEEFQLSFRNDLLIKTNELTTI